MKRPADRVAIYVAAYTGLRPESFGRCVDPTLISTAAQSTSRAPSRTSAGTVS